MDQLTDDSSPESRTGASVEHGVPVLETRRLSKRFAGVTVVDEATVTFRAGEVHGLVGQNGAGKSSLVKMVCGAYRADDGHVVVDGERVVFGSPRHALDHGITIVAQELSLVPALSVAENILLGHQPTRLGLVDRGASVEQVRDLIDEFGFDIDPSAEVSTLSPSHQQKVEILRALARDARLIVLDEPTSSMSVDDSTQLYDIIRSLAARGTAVVLVSHFLDEVLAECDVVTVMRDGEVVVNAAPSDELTSESIVESMIGEVVERGEVVRSEIDRSGTPRLAVRGLSGERFDDVSLEVYPGEIVAIVGLVGAGRTEVLRSIFGADRATAGQIDLDGTPTRFTHPKAAIRAGLAMVTEARKLDGIFPVLGTDVNIAAARPDEISRAGWIDRRRQHRVAATAASSVDVRAASLDTPISVLSGGNQQKALMARWLIDPPSLFLIDEPTRGVDVVSIGQIHDVIRRLAADGMSVLMVTSEFDEAIELAHRITVMRDGRVVHETDAADTDKAALVAASFGTDPTDQEHSIS